MSTNPSMERLTCVVDALTLVDNVHQMKQWVYSDLIHLHIPLCSKQSSPTPVARKLTGPSL